MQEIKKTSYLEIIEEGRKPTVLQLETLVGLVLTANGFQGDAGPIKTLSRHDVVTMETVVEMRLNVSEGSLWAVDLNKTDIYISIEGYKNSSKISQRMAIYFWNGEGSAVTWPSNVVWNDGVVPEFHSGYTSVMLDSFDGGVTIYGNWRSM